MAIPIAGIMGIVGDASAKVQPTKLTVGFMQGIDSMNPYVGLNDASYIFYGFVYDALGVIDNQMQPSPDLALDPPWAVPNNTGDPDMVGMPLGSVWQYNITQNAYWSDGEPFTADDVIYNIWLNAEKTHYESMWAYQPYSYFMHQAWKVNDYTVRISFWDRVTEKPMPASYAYLISIPMLPKHMLQGMNYADIGLNWSGVFSQLESPDMPIVGTGPFIAGPNIYDEWVAGDHLTLLKNPRYHWKADYGKEIKFDQLIMRFFQDSTTMVLALENNEIDIAAYPPTAWDAIKSDVDSGKAHNITAFTGPKITQYWTEIINCMNQGGPNPSRLDPVIRLAEHMATNKSYIIDNYYLGLADPGSTLIPPINKAWHYEPNATEMVQYNLSAARDLLEANGYVDTDGDTIRECTASSYAVQQGYVQEGKKLVYQMLVRKEYPEEKDIAKYIQGQWAQIGISIIYSVVEELKLSTDVYSYNYDTAIWYWSADIDPNYQLFAVSSYAINGWSDCKYESKAYDDNYTLSVQTIDREQRKVFVDNAQRVFYKDNVYIIMACPWQTYAWRNDTFTGWGDWLADPGRSMDNFWMGNPLFFDLVPQVPPPKPPLDWKVIAAGGAVAAAVVIALVYLFMRSRKKEGKIKEGGSPLGD